MKRFSRILCIILTVLAISCQKEKEPEIVKVTGVTLNSTSLTLTEGESQTLSATVSPQDAANKKVIWSTSNASVASVDNSGKVTASAAGSATITVTTDDGGKTATCKVTVNAKVYPVESVSLDKTAVELTEGETATLTATVKPDNASDKTVSWSSSQESVATVTDGVITAVSTGEATITVTTTDGGKTATCVVKVKAAVVPVSSVALDETTLEITIGDPDVKLVATVTPDNATDKSVNWASDKAEVATVDNQGSVHAVAPGEAIITVTTTDGGKTATCVVKVKAAVVPVSSVALNKTELTLTVGDPDVKLVATVTPDNATDKSVNWASDKAEVATVDNQGSVHAVAPGEAIITVTTTDGGKTATCTVKVKAALPANALSGEFSVSGTKKVHFSQGNLVATINASGTPTAWNFAAHQYDCLGENGANKTIGQAPGDIDFFGWSTASTTYGISKSKTSDDYSGDFVDWGKNMGDGNTWRTLTKDEWTYLFDNHSYKWASVNGVNGYVIAPDGFTGELASSYADDAALASAGNLVFLPAAGNRYGSNVSDVGGSGDYWSSTAYDGFYAYFVGFDSYYVYPDINVYRNIGFSVRLITESK